MAKKDMRAKANGAASRTALPVVGVDDVDDVDDADDVDEVGVEPDDTISPIDGESGVEQILLVLAAVVVALTEAVLLLWEAVPVVVDALEEPEEVAEVVIDMVVLADAELLPVPPAIVN
jgi:hypothetical protein